MGNICPRWVKASLAFKPLMSPTPCLWSVCSVLRPVSGVFQRGPLLLRLLLPLPHLRHPAHRSAVRALQEPQQQQESRRQERRPPPVDQRTSPQLLPHLSGPARAQPTPRLRRLSARRRAHPRRGHNRGSSRHNAREQIQTPPSDFTVVHRCVELVNQFNNFYPGGCLICVFWYACVDQNVCHLARLLVRVQTSRTSVTSLFKCETYIS